VGIGEERELRTACDVPVEEGLLVDTRSADVLRARQEAVEFILLDHAPDCATCSKAGECELQNYVRDWGRDSGRFGEERLQPGARERELSPRVRFYADRCVGCSRCIRFCDEISHSGELCRVGRGETAEVDIFPGVELDNPLAGNLVDLCPVGALVDPPRLYQPPAWLLQGVDTTCVGCSAGCAVRVDVYEGEVQRVVARAQPDLDQYWICDEGRYGWQQAPAQARLLRPRLRQGVDRWVEVSWERALEVVVARIRRAVPSLESGRVAAFLSASMSNEENYLLARMARELWPGNQVGLCSHRTEERDQHFGGGFVLRAEKVPNALGAVEMAVGNGLEVAAEDVWWEQIEKGEINVLYVLDGRAEVELSARARTALGALDFLVVQGTADSEWAQLADVFLPGAAVFETDGSCTNVDGRVQRLRRVVPLPGEALSHWSILVRVGIELGMQWQYARAGDIALELFAHLQGRYAGLDYGALDRMDRGRSAQAYGGGWATWLQRSGLIAVEDHTKRIKS
jgi:NADH-quinone oxidoreductase subunit G